MNEGPVVSQPQAKPPVAVAERSRPVIAAEASNTKAESSGQPKTASNVETPHRAFERIIQQAHAENSKESLADHAQNPREAIAGVAGWGIMGKVDIQIVQMHNEVIALQKGGSITEEKAVQFLGRIAKLSQHVKEAVTPGLQKLSEIALSEEKIGGEADPILRDLNLHMIKNDIKALETKNDPKDELALTELRGELSEAEAERQGLDPKDDEVVKLAIKLTGTKELPAKFKDVPLEAIEDFFNHQNLRAILKSDGKAASLAGKLGLDVSQLRELVRTYDLGKTMDVEMRKLNDEIIINDPKEGRGLRTKRLAKGGATIAMILSALSAYSMFSIVKKDSSPGGQG